MLPADTIAEEVDCGHGRVERRSCAVLYDLSLLEKPSEWASLHGLVRIEAERYHKVSGKTEREIRYYITSLKVGAAQLNGLIRQTLQVIPKSALQIGSSVIVLITHSANAEEQCVPT